MGGIGSGRKPKVYPEAMVDNVRRLYGSDMSQVEVAAALCTTPDVVKRIMRRHGIAARTPRPRTPKRGSDSPHWKGDCAGYGALHTRVGRLRGKPMVCEQCGTTTALAYDWANLSGRYEDPNDYRRLCRACHWRFDNRGHLRRRAIRLAIYDIMREDGL